MELAERKEKGHPLGIGRVLDKKICLPQAAYKLDNRLPIFSNELLIEVERLNVDAASFVQMEEEAKGNEVRIGQIILENTRTRGKQQNRITGSGGILIGSVKQIGSQYKGFLKAKVGDRVATLVSLTLTPLYIKEVHSVNLKNHQVEASGHAILFERSIAAPLPTNLKDTVAMALYDVAGAPALTYRLSKKNDTVVVIGAGGKAGTLSLIAARKKLGPKGKIIAIEPVKSALNDLKKLKVCDEILAIDATNPIAIHEAILKLTKGNLADLVINVASVPNTENSSLLSVSPKGRVLFFSMATDFAKVTLGAEGIAIQSQLFFGNGFVPGHAKFCTDLLASHKSLRDLFYKRYS